MLDNRNVLSVAVHAAGGGAAAAVFLTYPLGLGIWLGFTDTKIGRPGVFIGLENYISLFQDSVFLLSVFNTILYTVVATVLKFGLGLWLALLLNNHMPVKAFIRAIVLLPYIVPTVLSAIAFWWIYDAAVLDHLLGADEAGADRPLHRLPGRSPGTRACLGDRRQCLARHSVRRDLPAGRAADHLARRSTRRRRWTAPRAWQRFRHVTVPMLMPILAVVLTFSVLFTFTDFQLIYAITRGGPVNATHLMATLAFQRAIPGGQLARAPRSPPR